MNWLEQLRWDRLYQQSLREVDGVLREGKKLEALDLVRNVARKKAEACKVGLKHDQASPTLLRINRLAQTSASGYIHRWPHPVGLDLLTEQEIVVAYQQVFREMLLPDTKEQEQER